MIGEIRTMLLYPMVITYLPAPKEKRYLSSWSTPPPSCINFVDNDVIWGGDSKNNIQIGCNDLKFY